MLRFVGIVAFLIFGFDAVTNFEQPRPAPTPTQTSSYTSPVSNPVTTSTPTPEPVATQTPVPVATQKVSQPTPVTQPVAPAPAPETLQGRLNRIAASLGIHTPVTSGACSYPGIDPSTIRGCYAPGSNLIYITKYATMYDDSYVGCIMKHESRHVWQEASNLYQYKNGEIINRDWLEADARAYSGC